MALAVALLLAGCGELTSGGAGEVEIEIVADTVPFGAAASPLQGTLTVGVQVFARRGTRSFELTDGPQELDLPLAGAATVLVSRKTLPSGRYRGERLVFRKVEADVEGGLEVNGEPFVGEVAVDLGSGDALEIPWEVEIVLPEDGLVAIVLEMRAPRWLRLLDPELRRVSRQGFEANPPRVRPAP
jgi:hypothetical protein